MRKWYQLLQEGTTTHDHLLPPIHVHYLNRTSGKFSSTLHTILILHQVIITFPHLTKFLVDKSLKSEQEMKHTAQDGLKGLATTFSNKGIQNPSHYMTSA
jgi:hypothetical protein